MMHRKKVLRQHVTIIILIKNELQSEEKNSSLMKPVQRRMSGVVMLCSQPTTSFFWMIFFLIKWTNKLHKFKDSIFSIVLDYNIFHFHKLRAHKEKTTMITLLRLAAFWYGFCCPMSTYALSQFGFCRQNDNDSSNNNNSNSNRWQHIS